MIRFALFVSLVVSTTHELSGQTPSGVHDLLAERDRKEKEFQKGKADAKTRALKQFDKLIIDVDKISASRMSVEARRTHKESLKTAKGEFADKGEWSDDESVYGIQSGYAFAVAKAYSPLAKAFRSLIVAYDKAGNSKEADKWQQAKQQFDDQFPGRDEFKPGTTWSGTRTGLNKMNVNSNLFVAKVEGNIVTGTINSNTGVANHPILDVEGELNGNLLLLKVTKVKQGNGQYREYTGLLLGEGRLFLIEGGIDKDGKTMGGITQLKLNQPKKK